MDYKSGRRLFTHPDEIQSSLSRQRWPRFPLAHSHPVVETAGPSQQANSYRYESALDDSAQAYRTTALRHLSESSRPLSWSHRQVTQTNGRHSTSPSQPVLVRAYSGGPGDSTKTSKMSLRRSFPFAGRAETPRRGPELPSDEDFSIDGILRAIEPNIRHTLDSIGEICGRSKLSLANEYGSHIAPLGEIRAPPGGLMPVDEASSEHERQATDNVVIYDDDHSVMDGRDHPSSMQFGLMENARHSTGPRNAGFPSMPSFYGGDGSSVQVHPDTPRSMGFSTTVDSESALGPLPTTREIASRPKSCGRVLLATDAESGTDDRRRLIQTPALVSEVLLDAQADGHTLGSESHVIQSQPLFGNSLDLDVVRRRWSLPAVGISFLTEVFGWLKYAVRDGSDFGQTLPTAEMRLRAMLARQQDPETSGVYANDD
ncbi:hypothetical protein ABOM_010782 [Aspergillus bombycis]|uniref:Uncharacterized protein n=1 Tax=Aspergillus bombycis TaxID=109264 RepID=A0A1F7ZNC8_9EURO|nr:hypothetical protein ABOM_010782 [Aspergillus bombycis]OGM40545.1 hypothetical protein ABOM_010782 [Aspergillus bombycis]